jgi:hypothetical protein
MRLALAGLALAALTGGTSAHPCDADAIQRATPLLKLHYEIGDDVQNLAIGDEVKELAPIKALKGNGKFDVLEVWGYIYKAEYRMRFIYAQIPGSCVLMGQEILEASDPYQTSRKNESRPLTGSAAWLT